MRTVAAATARAADGDFKIRGPGHKVRDTDGDHEATPALTGAWRTRPGERDASGAGVARQGRLTAFRFTFQ